MGCFHIYTPITPNTQLVGDFCAIIRLAPNAFLLTLANLAPESGTRHPVCTRNWHPVCTSTGTRHPVCTGSRLPVLQNLSFHPIFQSYLSYCDWIWIIFENFHFSFRFIRGAGVIFTLFYQNNHQIWTLQLMSISKIYNMSTFWKIVNMVN